jgi:two-component system, chemotaxis family, sensor kinase CheA
MDTSEYMPMFLAESREHLQELNLSVVKLEENPEDRATLDEIFRIAHSLKGMSATMGFAQIAELTHEMEEVFELLRQRSGALSGEAVDTVLACLDALSGAVDGIETDGQESLDPGPLQERLRQLVRAGDADQPPTPDRRKGTDRRKSGDRRKKAPAAKTQPAAAAPVDIDPELQALAATVAADGSRLLRVRVVLDEQVLMPAARALMLMTALTELGEVARSEPPQNAVESFQGREIEVWVMSQLDESQVAEAARGITDVVSVEVSDVAAAVVSEPAEPPEEPAAAQAAPPQPEPSAPAEPEAPKPAAAPAPAGAGGGGGGGSHAARTVRVDSERLDALMHSMGELVIHRTAVEALTSGLDMPELQQAVQDLTRSSQSLQAMVMQVRMIPVDIVFLRFPRLVRDLSTKLGKEVDLQLVGKETELDRTVVDALGDPLVHLVRNALDHGLEPPEERVAAGKPQVGVLEIAARHAGGSVVIEVRDDGHGISPEAVARKAVKRGLIDEDTAANIDMRGAVELLFSPGFSMAEVASDISGRGVGMDVVRTKIRELGGEVVLDSSPGVGTTAQIRLPLTLAIVSALQVDVAGAPFAIPLDRVERTLRLDRKMVRSVAGRRMLVLEDGVLPLLEGAATFGRAPTGQHELIVIVRGEDRRLGLAVDQLVGQRELVTRPLPPIVADGEPVSGGAVLADGRIALIVDCDKLAAQILSPAVAGVGSPPAVAAASSIDQPEELAA